MKPHPIHLAQAPTARGWAKSIGTSAKDAQIINGVLEVSTNLALGNKTVYVAKRAGSAARADTPTASGLVALKHYSSRFSQLYATATALYEDDTNIGTLTGLPSAVSNYQLCDTVISNVGVLGFVTSDFAGWVLYENAISTNFPTFTGTTTNGSAIVTGIASTTGIYKGNALSAAAGVPAGARVLSVDSSTQITMTANATATGSRTITKEAVAKITDANFPSDATNMETMDGYFFVGTAQGVRNSPINDPFTWDTDKLIAADSVGDDVNLIFKIGDDYICASGEVGNIQYFYNGGNASGSILSKADNLNVYGISCVHRPTQQASGVYFIGQEKIDSTLTKGFYRINGVNSIEPVSDDVWSGIITDQSLSFASPITNGNKSLIALHSSSVSTFPVYDPVVNTFTLFEIDAALTSAFRLAYTKSGTSTAINWAQGNTWNDSGSAYDITVQTEPQDIAGGLGVTDIEAELLADNEDSADYGGCNFDGSTDYFDGNALTGIADGKKGSFVAVVRFGDAAAATDVLMGATGDAFRVIRLSDGDIAVIAENAAGTTILSHASSTLPCASAGTYVIMISWDMGTSGSVKLYVNDTAYTTTGTFTDDTIDYTVAEYSLGANETGAAKFTGDMYFLWFDPTTNLDFSDSSVRAKFPTQTSGKFVGVNGELPTGTQPILFLGYGSGTGWAVNRGSATSSFTTNGTPVAATTSYTGENVTGFSVTDNDYTSWTYKNGFDMTQTRKRLHRLGYHKSSRAYRLQHCLNTPWRAQLLRIKPGVGST